MLPFILSIFGVVFILPQTQTFLRRLLGTPPREPPLREPSSPTSHEDELDDHDSSYKPTPIDVYVTRVLLSRGTKLPPDIVDTIFDFAEYWAHSSNEIDFLKTGDGLLRIRGRSPKEDQFILRSFPIGLTGLEEPKNFADVAEYNNHEIKPRPLSREHPASYFSKLANYPTPRLAHPVRKIVFTTVSRDQGFGVHRSEEPYADSWTWFEAGLERFDADQTSDSERINNGGDLVPFSLPISALRPIYPLFHKVPKTAPPPDASTEDEGNTDEPEYRYDHGYLPVDERLIQCNKARHAKMTKHIVEWSWTDNINPESDGGQELKSKGRGRATGDGSFVRDLKMGDVVTVWGKAKFPAWVNHVEKVKIDVYWAV